MGDVLTARDRCDRCGSQAYVRTILIAGLIDLCAHDYRRHESAITSDPGWLHVIDERHRLTGGVEKAKREGVS